MIGTAGRLAGHFYIHDGDAQVTLTSAVEFFNSLALMFAVRGSIERSASGSTPGLWTSKVSTAGGRIKDDGRTSSHARVGFRMTVVSPWGCPGLRGQRRHCRLVKAMRIPHHAPVSRPGLKYS